ncbi:right-handed parallel beta-helix repeat-containing protein [Paenibacillus ferrarius]|uniref:right-handed parallel beta-helix repeat-containing protein n=1 Tax=Paenibacillus ferrarius TaxID=1469647 RepID=UPI003D2A7A91
MSKVNRKVSALTLSLAIACSIGILPDAAGASVALPTLPTQKHNQDVSVPAGASTSTIQSAINSASSAGGGTVTLASGEYTITAPLVLKSNVTLNGAGKNSTVLKRNAGTNLGANGVLTTSTSGGVVNVIVTNLGIDGNSFIDPDTNPDHDSITNYGALIQGPDNTNDKILFDNFKVKNSTMGLHIKGSKNVTIQNSDFNNNGGSYLYWHNMYLRRVSKVLVKNNVMSYSSSGNGLNISYSDNITIDSNSVYYNYFRGIRVADSSYIDTVNNIVHDNKTGDGIIYNSESTGVTNFKINSNTVKNNGGYGILVNSSSSNGEVKNNIDGGGNASGFKKIDGSNVAQ